MGCVKLIPPPPQQVPLEASIGVAASNFYKVMAQWNVVLPIADCHIELSGE